MKMHRSRISWPSPMLSRGLSQRQKKKNHYDSLEVDSKATQNEIKSAYFKLTMQYHPDKNPSDAAKVKFRNIAEAYEVLGNYDKRKQYDRGMQIKSDDRKKQEVHRPQDFTKEAQRVRTAIYRQSTDTTGTSKMYDFDEWTKAHYGKTFRRRMYEKKDLKEIVEEREYFRAAENNSTKEMKILAAVMCTIALFVGLVTNNNTLDNPNSEIGDEGGKGT